MTGIAPDIDEEILKPYFRFMKLYYDFVKESIGLLLYKPSFFSFGQNPNKLREKLIKEVHGSHLPVAKAQVKSELNRLNELIESYNNRLKRQGKKFTKQLNDHVDEIIKHFETKEVILTKQKITESGYKEACIVFFEQAKKLREIMDNFNEKKIISEPEISNVSDLNEKFSELKEICYRYNNDMKENINHLAEAARHYKKCAAKDFVENIS